MKNGSDINPFTLLRNYLSEKEFDDLIHVDFSNAEIFRKYFETIWKRNDLVQFITSKIPNNFPGKNDEKFRNLLFEGVSFHKENKFTEALLKYNKSILFASHSKDECDQSKVAKLYAVRSILLYEMKRFEDAIHDINRAFQHGKFKEDHKRCLLHTIIKCLIKLNRGSIADNLIKKLYNQAEEAGDENWLIRLQSLQDMCNAEKITSVNEDRSMPTCLDFKSETQSFIRNCESYDETNIINDSIRPSYSDLNNSERHFIANRDIEPGELLMTERAICSIPRLQRETLSLFCCVCNRRTKIALPCDKCSLVTFCSKECIISRNNNHKMECSILYIFIDMDVDYHLPLVFRTLLKFKMHNIYTAFFDLFKNYSNRFESSEQFVRTPVTYRTLTNLNGNWDKRKGEFCLQMAANAILCVKLFQGVSEFWENPNKLETPIEQNLECLTYLGGEIIKLQFNFQCNAYFIKELLIDKKTSIINSGIFYSGYGIYKSFSLLNYSCSPNSLYSNYKDMVYLYSINFIPKGNTVFVDYGVRYINLKSSYRRNYLKHYYCFDCKCQACLQNWPVYDLLSNDYDIICPSCSTLVKKNSKLCSCFLATTINEMGIEVQKQNELIKIVINIQEAFEECKNSLYELEKCNFTSESIKNIANFIQLMQKHTILPHKNIAMAEKMLHVCFGLIGNKHYLNSN